MTPLEIRAELRLIRLQVEKIGRVDTRYRRHTIAALSRLNRLAASLKSKPGPKKGSQP